jgi:hypothetical protein
MVFHSLWTGPGEDVWKYPIKRWMAVYSGPPTPGDRTWESTVDNRWTAGDKPANRPGLWIGAPPTAPAIHRSSTWGNSR